MASILGTVLTTAETGWKRIYNNDPAFVYTNFLTDSDGNFSSGVDYYTTALNAYNGAITNATLDSNNHANRAAEIRINFTGTKLRIINLLPNSAEEAKPYIGSVYIDGTYYGHLYSEIKNNTWQYRTVTFEKTDLSDTSHLLQIVLEPGSYRFWFDSIDVDTNSVITSGKSSAEFDEFIKKNYDKIINNIKDGDILTCKYTYSSPLNPGAFSEFRLTTTPVSHSYSTPTETGRVVSDTFEFYEPPKHKELYTINKNGLIFNYNATFSTIQGSGYSITDSIDLKKDFKEVIDIDESNLSALVIPNDIILKTTDLIDLKSIGNFSGITVSPSIDDVYYKYLVSVNNDIFYYFDKTNNAWRVSSISDIATNGMDDISDVCNTDSFLQLINGKTKIGLAILIGIKDPDDVDKFDYTKNRYVSIVNIKQGNIEATTSSKSVNMNLLFTYIDGNKKNNRLHFIADTVVQKGIPWSSIYGNIGTTEVDLTVSDYYPQLFFTIPSSNSSKDDYANYILKDETKFDCKDNYSWVYHYTSKDNTLYGLAMAQKDKEIAQLAANSNNDIGLRPEIIIDKTQRVMHRYNSDCILPVVRKMSDLKPGYAIACTYTAPTSGTPGEFTIGKNGKDIIPDYGTATPDGYFYWICVGKAFSGALKLVADRNIQTYISWEALNTAGYCTTSGKSVRLGSVKNCIIRLPHTVSEKVSGRENPGEWDQIISYYSQNGINASSNAIWNASSLNSWTLVTPQDAMGNRIVRGKQDEDTVADTYTQENVVSTTVDRFIGFRPVAEVPTEAMQATVDYPECKLEIAKSLGTCKVGQAVLCEYRSDTANTYGAFNFNPDKNKEKISDPASTTPNGLFYFVCVGKAFSGAKKFIADRNIQTGISWEVLNTAGFCVTSGRDMSEETGIKGSLMRLIHSDVTNYDMDLSSSEWDQVLMQSTIGNTDISTEKINDWNMFKSFSWMLDTPHEDGFVELAHTMSDRVIRGMEKNDYSQSPKLFIDSSTVNSSLGFRPVLEVPTRTQSVSNDTIIDATHASTKNPKNANIGISGSFALFDENQTYKNCKIRFLVNNEDTEITCDLDDTLSYNIELPIDKLTVGDNRFTVEITTQTEGEDPIKNLFNYTIEKEDIKKLTKKRDYSSYTGGFKYDKLSIDHSKVVNNNKPISVNTPEKVDIPANTISITFKEE